MEIQIIILLGLLLLNILQKVKANNLNNKIEELKSEIEDKEMIIHALNSYAANVHEAQPDETPSNEEIADPGGNLS